MKKAVALFLLLSSISAFGIVTKISLQQKQARFALAVSALIIRAYEMGYDVTFGEAWRSAEAASFKVKQNAEKGTGIYNSLHRIRLAIDLNLFVRATGKYLTQTADYQQLGEWWESQSTGVIRCVWGGRFKRADGNHFSFEHEGVQ